MCLKVIILLSAVVVLATASHYGGGGHSNSFRKQDDHGNYAFGYDIVDHKGAKNFRKESGDGHGNKVGSYGLHDVDGRLRIVDYVADGHGFRAKIRTNEPGTTNKDSAAAVYNGPDPKGYSSSHIPSGKVPPQPNYGPVPYASAGHGYGAYTPALGNVYSAQGAYYGGPDQYSHGDFGPVGAYSHSAPVFMPYFGY
ncbi:cuticle protein 14-like [Oppia nitens]|uniref:cuticle protein 14-like n=1 Tax=Oppia nitens TaxID=1686743 RepID=UPI0023DAB4B5|nr:cuticle protein 14-like [Oppia nitens]